MTLLEKDRYLLNEKNRPQRKQKLDYLTCWNEAVQSAEIECEGYMPQGQTRITEWLQESPG